MSGLVEKIASRRRNNIRAKLYSSIRKNMQTDRDKFLSIRDVCNILNVDISSVQMSKSTDPDELLTSICAWDFYLLPGSLYAALPLYANLSPDKAMERGARALLTDKQESGYPCIIVPDVMEAYCRLCGAIQSRSNPKTIAVTGSVGKTTTKDMVKSVFSQKYSVFCDVENNNMATLVGYLVQRMPRDCDCYVQEVHEGDSGSAESISKIIHPDVAVITNIGESHLGNFDSYEGLVKGVTDITEGMPDTGIVIIDGNDVSSATASWNRRVVKVSAKDVTADYHAENIQVTDNGLKFDIVFPDGHIHTILHMYGLHNVTDALLAFAAGVESGVTPEQAVKGLGNYVPNGMRQNIVREGNRTFYIDCFNAAVKSMKTALDTLGELPVKQGGARIAVLGDMAELGEDSDAMHREVGKMAAQSNLDVLICYGPLSAGMAEEARKTKKFKVFHTEKISELNKMVRENVGPNDAVLFKASHATNLIATVKANYPLVYFKTVTMDQLRRQTARASILK